MKFIWIQFQITKTWNQPQGWKRLGVQWNYLRLPFAYTLLFIHGWGSAEAIKLWSNPEQ